VIDRCNTLRSLAFRRWPSALGAPGPHNRRWPSALGAPGPHRDRSFATLPRRSVAATPNAARAWNPPERWPTRGSAPDAQRLAGAANRRWPSALAAPGPHRDRSFATLPRRSVAATPNAARACNPPERWPTRGSAPDAQRQVMGVGGRAGNTQGPVLGAHLVRI